MDAVITSPAGVIATLAAVAAFFFFLEKKYDKLKIWSFFPPLIPIYVLPVFLSNVGLIPNKSGVYDFMGDSMLPFFLVIMLLEVDVFKTIRVMGKGVFVMLMGTLGVVVGAPLGFVLVSHGLDSEAWKGFAALAGSWIGGTGNMLAVGNAFELDESSLNFGYAVIADNAVYLFWLPLLLTCKNWSGWFGRFSKMSADRVETLEKAAQELTREKGKPEMRHYLYLICFGFAVTAIAAWLAPMIEPVVSEWLRSAFGPDANVFPSSAYKILIVSIAGVALSFTRASDIPGSHALAMAMIYLFVARMGAKADLSNIDWAALWFLLGAVVWIFTHGLFLLAGARLFKVDVHTAAIASAANIGGAASAPIVAAFHNPVLVPVSILMALLGYAVGTPAAMLAGILCRWIG